VPNKLKNKYIRGQEMNRCKGIIQALLNKKLQDGHPGCLSTCPIGYIRALTNSRPQEQEKADQKCTKVIPIHVLPPFKV
jgi:predicted nucleic acid binding AN1-type Zn finger protein